MNSTYRFANLPSHSSVAAGVTVLACAWFLVAAGTLVSEAGFDSHREAAQAVRPAQAAAEIAPEARLKIVVTASRSAAL